MDFRRVGRCEWLTRTKCTVQSVQMIPLLSPFVCSLPSLLQSGPLNPAMDAVSSRRAWSPNTFLNILSKKITSGCKQFDKHRAL